MSTAASSCGGGLRHAVDGAARLVLRDGVVALVAQRLQAQRAVAPMPVSSTPTASPGQSWQTLSKKTSTDGR